MVSNGSRSAVCSIAVVMLQGLGWLPVAQAQVARFERETLMIVEGESLPVLAGGPFARLAVSEPKVADAAPVSTTEYYVRGRTIGTTNILIYSDDGNLQQVIDVKVTPNLPAIRSDLQALFPELAINLYPVADRVHVRGQVPDAETADAVLEIVSSHAPGRAINAMSIALPQQVLLEVRFVEASRDDIREIGFGSEIGRPGNFLLLTTPALLSGPVEKTAGALLGGSGGVSIDVFLKALEEKGVVRTLAEPNLVSRSGEPAYFLAGGEFPVPVAADEGNIAIAFKNFGVSLTFTPTVVNTDRIVLKVAPEVSQLDPRNSVRLSDVEIPALSVRKIDTTVELGNGQSFAIAGLIQNNYDSSAAQTPLLGSVPILGALFRSSRFRNNETELVVIVTPRLVEAPQAGHVLSDPLAETQLPGAAERYLLGKADAKGKRPLGQSVEANIDAQLAKGPAQKSLAHGATKVGTR